MCSNEWTKNAMKQNSTIDEWQILILSSVVYLYFGFSLHILYCIVLYVVVLFVVSVHFYFASLRIFLIFSFAIFLIHTIENEANIIHIEYLLSTYYKWTKKLISFKIFRVRMWKWRQAYFICVIIYEQFCAERKKILECIGSPHQHFIWTPFFVDSSRNAFISCSFVFHILIWFIGFGSSLWEFQWIEKEHGMATC